MNPTPRNSIKQTDIFNYRFVNKKLVLKRPSNNEHSFDFFNTLTSRSSNSNLKSLHNGALDYLLWYTCKIKNIAVDKGYILSHRSSPSAGAIHPIDILPQN